MISQKTIQLIFETAKIEEVVGDFVHLRPRGINRIGLCPFHNEKTPSFTVSPAKNIYKCFGCGAGGNAVNFVMDHEHLSYPEALRYLAKRYNIEIEETETSDEYKAQQRLADSLYIINEFAGKYFQRQLLETDYGRSVGLGYFKERGFREDIIRKFGLGFANGQNSDFLQAAKAQQYKLELLQKAGLLTRYGKDFFRNRVQFPIHNLSGKIVGFGGRILIADKKQPKYINTPESEIYNKSKSLYGIFFARKAIVKKKLCYMAEGYTDVLSLHQAGIENTVASSGTSLTVGQIQLVKRYTPNITFLYDGDAAGVKAALRGLELVLEQDMNVKVVLLPDGEDPDSYLRKVGATAFEEYVATNANDFILFKTQLLLGETKNDPIRRAELLKDIVKTVAKIPDALKRSVYVRECATLLKVQEQIIHTEINKLLYRNLKKHSENQEKEEALKAGPPTEVLPSKVDELPAQNTTKINKALTEEEFQEKGIVRVLMLFGGRKFSEDETVAEFVLTNMVELLEEFDNQLYADIISDCIDAFEEEKILSPEDFTQYQRQEVAQLAISFMTEPYVYSEGWEKFNVYLNNQKMPEQNHLLDAKSTIAYFKLRKLKRLAKRNQESLLDLQKQKADFEMVMQKMRVQKRLKEMIAEMAKHTRSTII
ncbi:MAG: DNA primase [Saprospiraceae bacterium]|nr:DNA primase [Saprospiraceae bacterium]